MLHLTIISPSPIEVTVVSKGYILDCLSCWTIYICTVYVLKRLKFALELSLCWGGGAEGGRVW